jgi:hypothetical protein
MALVNAAGMVFNLSENRKRILLLTALAFLTMM